MKFKPTDLHNSREKLYRLPKESQNESKNPKDAAHSEKVQHDDHGDVIIGSRKDTPKIEKP